VNCSDRVKIRRPAQATPYHWICRRFRARRGCALLLVTGHWQSRPLRRSPFLGRSSNGRFWSRKVENALYFNGELTDTLSASMLFSIVRRHSKFQAKSSICAGRNVGCADSPGIRTCDRAEERTDHADGVREAALAHEHKSETTARTSAARRLRNAPL